MPTGTVKAHAKFKIVHSSSGWISLAGWPSGPVLAPGPNYYWDASNYVDAESMIDEMCNDVRAVSGWDAVFESPDKMVFTKVPAGVPEIHWGHYGSGASIEPV